MLLALKGTLGVKRSESICLNLQYANRAGASHELLPTLIPQPAGSSADLVSSPPRRQRSPKRVLRRSWQSAPGCKGTSLCMLPPFFQTSSLSGETRGTRKCSESPATRRSARFRCLPISAGGKWGVFRRQRAWRLCRKSLQCFHPLTGLCKKKKKKRKLVSWDLRRPRGSKISSESGYECILLFFETTVFYAKRISTCIMREPSYYVFRPFGIQKGHLRTVSASRDLLYSTERCSVLCGSLDGREGAGRERMHLYAQLSHSAVHQKLSQHRSSALLQDGLPRGH